jgi:hypothetical protein
VQMVVRRAQLVPDGDDALDVPDGLDDVSADLVVSGRTRHDASWTVTCRRSGSIRSPCRITRSVTSRRIFSSGGLKMLSTSAWLTIPASRSSWSLGLSSCPIELSARLCLLAGLRVAQPLDQRLEQVPGDGCVLLHERPELPVGEPVAHELGARRETVIERLRNCCPTFS